MPCRHEGGTDTCERDAAGHCKALSRKSSRKWKRANVGRVKELDRRNRSANCAATPSDAGEAGELLVAADLLTRGLPTTKPYNRNGADDLHVKVGPRWWNVQVKLGRVHAITKHISAPRPNKRITSDIIASVDLLGKRIRYLSNTDEPLPKELL